MPAPAKTYHHGDLREALVAAGTALLRERGGEDFTLRECARRAGVSHAAPKHHFPGFDDLLAEIAARGFEAFTQALETAAADCDTAGSRLQAMSEAYLRFAASQPAIYGLMFGRRRISVNAPRLKAAAGAAWDQIRSAAAAVTGPAAAATSSAYVWSAVHGLAMLRHDKWLPVQSVGDMAFLGMVWQGLPKQAS